MAKNEPKAEVAEVPANTISATAKLKDKDGNLTGEEVTESVTYDFGSTVVEAIDKFGEEVVYTNFKQAAIIAAQSRIRSHILAGLRGADLQAKISEWKPGVKSIVRKSPVDKIKGILEGKSPEEIAELLKAAGIV